MRQMAMHQLVGESKLSAQTRYMMDCVYVVAGKSLLTLHIVFFQNFMFDCVSAFS
jgi:hypothetical protein